MLSSTRRNRSTTGVACRIARTLIAVTLGLTSVVTLAARTADAASAGPTIVTTAKAEAPAAAGGLALVSVVVRTPASQRPPPPSR